MLLMHVFHVHLLFCASIFHRQYIHMLLMHVFCIHLLFVQVFFVNSFMVVHLLFMQVFSSSVHGNTHASYASVFCRPYMMRTQIFISEFFGAIIWTMIPLGCSILHLSFES
jgi:hypothetical protein